MTEDLYLQQEMVVGNHSSENIVLWIHLKSPSEVFYHPMRG